MFAFHVTDASDFACIAERRKFTSRGYCHFFTDFVNWFSLSTPVVSVLNYHLRCIIIFFFWTEISMKECHRSSWNLTRIIFFIKKPSDKKSRILTYCLVKLSYLITICDMLNLWHIWLMIRKQFLYEKAHFVWLSFHEQLLYNL